MVFPKGTNYKKRSVRNGWDIFGGEVYAESGEQKLSLPSKS